MSASDFQGWLIKFRKNNKLFPLRYIERSTYQSTPLQRSEIKAYRDSNNLLHRVTSPNYKTKIEFQTVPLTLAQLGEIRTVLNGSFSNTHQRKTNITYWDDELLRYRNATVYIPDITYNVKTVSAHSVCYLPITFTFIEY